MIKPLKVFLFVSLSSLILSACGATKSSSGTSQPVVQGNPPAAGTAATDTSKDANAGLQASSTNPTAEKITTSESSPSQTKPTSKESEMAKEKQIEIDGKGNKPAKATLFEAAHLPLYLYTLPGYQASEAKSGNEIVVASKNQSIKMSISPLEKGMTIEEAKKQSMEEMKKISQSVKEITTLKTDKFYQNATVLYSSNSKDIESVYILPIDGFPVKVTIDRPVKTDTVLPYLQAMMKTVAVKN